MWWICLKSKVTAASKRWNWNVTVLLPIVVKIKITLFSKDIQTRSSQGRKRFTHLHSDQFTLFCHPFLVTYSYLFVSRFVKGFYYAPKTCTVLSCPSKKHSSFNVLCIWICFFERWQSSLFRISFPALSDGKPTKMHTAGHTSKTFNHPDISVREIVVYSPPTVTKLTCVSSQPPQWGTADWN